MEILNYVFTLLTYQVHISSDLLTYRVLKRTFLCVMSNEEGHY